MKKSAITCVLILMSLFLQAAVPVTDKIDWNLQDAYKEQTSTLEKICLNGLWKISLQDGKGLFKQKSMSKRETILMNLKGVKSSLTPEPTFMTEKTWSTSRVPGLWYDGAYWSPILYESMLGLDQYSKPSNRVCNKVKWLGKSLKDYDFAWYEREFTVPAEWKSGDLYIEFERINREGWLFINGKYIGHQKTCNDKDFLLPADIKAGQKVKLTILVSAFVDGDETLFMGHNQVSKIRKTANFRGIPGDVWLKRQISKEQIESVFINPSYRNKSLNLRIKFSAQPTGSVQGVIKNYKDGKVVKEFTIKAETGKKYGENEYEYSVDWSDPVCWNPDNPFLYNLQLIWNSEAGKLIDAPLAYRFGFRELWIDGRDYYLNGHKVHFRITNLRAMPHLTAVSTLTSAKEMGFNASEIGTNLTGGFNIKETLRVGDEIGIMFFVVVPNINDLVHTWADSKTQEDWFHKLKIAFDNVKNNPSVVQWSMNTNLLGYPFDLEPNRLGTDYYPKPGSAPASKWEVARESEKIFTKLDPSRPIFHHAGGNFGQAHTSNMYLNFSPLQEKSEWPSVWVNKGVKPFMAIELGMPYIANYYRNRESVTKHNNYKTEALFAEYAARLFGPDAYLMNKPARMGPIIGSKVVPGAISDGSDYYKSMEGYHYGGIRRKAFPEFVKSQTLLMTFLKDWRAYGVSGFTPWFDKYTLWEGILPHNGKVAEYESLKTTGYKTIFEFKTTYKKATELYDNYVKLLQPELFYISGAKAEFTDKTHAYTNGSDITKGIAWVNDTFTMMTKKFTVKLLTVEGKELEVQTYKLTAEPGEIIIHDFKFTAPAVSRKTSFKITLTVNSKLYDSFEIQTFPEPAGEINLTGKLYLLDSNGETKEYFKKHNISFKEYRGQSLDKTSTLVIGKDSVSAVKENVVNAVKSGTRLLVMAQTSEDLESYFGLRAFNAYARRVFKGKDNHPIYAGLDNTDLSYWAGKTTMLNEYTVPEKDGYPKTIWHFGNKQVVASVVLEKPHKGAFRSLLHEGFDLDYTPLLEEKAGKGTILFCQLDLTGRTKENPAGTIIFKNMLKYLDSLETNVTKPVYASGQAAKIMDISGVEYSTLESVSAIPADSIAVIANAGKKRSLKAQTIMKNLGMTPGRDVLSEEADNLKTFVQNGGTAVFVAQSDLQPVNKMFDLNLAVSEMAGYWFAPQVIDSLTMGIGGGDWYWKDKYNLPLPQKEFPLLQVNKGKGKVIICQVDPFYYPKNELHQRRQRSQRKFTRILATVMANLNGESTQSSLDIMTKQAGLKSIDLEGKWSFKIDKDEVGVKEEWFKKKLLNSIQLDVPGNWEAQGVKDANPKVNGKLPYDGQAWYQLEVNIPAAYKSKQLYLEMGSADDFDWTYFNGVMIGKTGEENPQYWKARRYYPIPAKLIKYGHKNTITVQIFDKYMGGGITSGPVRITFENNKKIPYLDANVDQHLRFNPYHFHRW